MHWITRINQWIGKSVAWLSLFMMIALVSVVILRYGFQTGAILLQESVMYQHAMVLLLTSAMTLSNDGHVRVDILYRNWSARKQALATLTGIVFFLWPFCFCILYVSWDYVLASWQLRETSSEPGGIPYVYLLKSLLLVFPLQLILQGLVEALNAKKKLTCPNT